MKYYEKIVIASIIFVLVVVATAGIVGNYVKTKNRIDEKEKNSIVLDTIHLF